jgi:hypothetical protein
VTLATAVQQLCGNFDGRQSDACHFDRGPLLELEGVSLEGYGCMNGPLHIVNVLLSRLLMDHSDLGGCNILSSIDINLTEYFITTVDYAARARGGTCETVAVP